MNCAKQMLIDNWDIFFWGTMFGGLFILSMQFIEKALNTWLKKKQMQLDLTLGKALIDMKEKLK